MKKPKTVDVSLTERHRIVTLLARVGDESVTVEEMDRIGATLQQAGLRALSPLVRRLWREKNGNVISRYAYLLDFFADDTWVDQLVQIALRRNDLEEEGKLALLAVLEGCGVDVTAPPFGELFDEGWQRQGRLPLLLERGEEGLVIFLEDLLIQTPEERRDRIAELATVGDHRVVGLLEILLGVDLPDLAVEAITALGRIRAPEAARLLERTRSTLTGPLLRQAEKSLRRLGFLGIRAGGADPPVSPAAITSACVSPMDGAGYLVLWFCRPNGQGRFVAVCLRVHGETGIHSVWGASSLTEQDAEKQKQALSCEEGAISVSPEYAVLLLKDAVHRSYLRNQLLPADFYVWRRTFKNDEVSPLLYLPVPPEGDSSAAIQARQVTDGDSLFDDDCFAGWILATRRVYDYAEEWLAAEQELKGKDLSRAVEGIVRRFCSELLEPDRERLRQRLLFTADLMARIGKERETVHRTVAVASSLTPSGVATHRNPFLRRFALESMDMAREALAEGFDLRLQADVDDEWE